MRDPKPEELREFAGLRNTKVQAYLERSYLELCESLVKNSDPHAVRLLQGQAQALLKLRGYIDPQGLSTERKA